METKGDKTGKTWNRAVWNIKFLLKIISLKYQRLIFPVLEIFALSLWMLLNSHLRICNKDTLLEFEKIWANGDVKYLSLSSSIFLLPTPICRHHWCQAVMRQLERLQAVLVPVLQNEKGCFGVFGLFEGFLFVCLLEFFIFGVFFFKMISHCPGPPEATQPRQKAKGITPGCSTALMWPLNAGYLENGICLQKNVLITPWIIGDMTKNFPISHSQCLHKKQILKRWHVMPQT